VLKANVRGRILASSNWELLLGFSQVFTSSPTAPTMLTALLGRRGKAAGFTHRLAALLCGGP